MRIGPDSLAAFGVCAALFIAGAAPSSAQDLFIYPAKGQSQEQQDKDRYECHSWAVQQSGFDPSRPSPVYASSGYATAPQGGVLGNAARGAAVGAVGGAIAGDARKGAAIGATTGVLIGGMRRNNQLRQQQYQAQQAANANAALRGNYERAIAACLEGRGYSVD